MSVRGFEIFKIISSENCHETVAQACVNIGLILRPSLMKVGKFCTSGITTISLCGF